VLTDPDVQEHGCLALYFLLFKRSFLLSWAFAPPVPPIGAADSVPPPAPTAPVDPLSAPTAPVEPLSAPTSPVEPLSAPTAPYPLNHG
jgi:hypothetical protein